MTTKDESRPTDVIIENPGWGGWMGQQNALPGLKAACFPFSSECQRNFFFSRRLSPNSNQLFHYCRHVDEQSCHFKPNHNVSLNLTK